MKLCIVEHPIGGVWGLCREDGKIMMSRGRDRRLYAIATNKEEATALYETMNPLSTEQRQARGVF